MDYLVTLPQMCSN